MRGNPVDRGACQQPVARERSMPLVPPVSLVNGATLKAFNTAYFAVKSWRAGRSIQHYRPFLYPLDALHHWNRIYGPSGFFQYQSVVPSDHAEQAVKAMMAEIGRSGEGSFLAVLKTFADRKPVGLLSFPRAGATLALDFPNKGDSTLRLLDKLDAIVSQAGGRLYPAKDARMPRALFEAGYPRFGEFMKFRDPGISSGLSRRLMGW
jgi:hypothetical protein